MLQLCHAAHKALVIAIVFVAAQGTRQPTCTRVGSHEYYDPACWADARDLATSAHCANTFVHDDFDSYPLKLPHPYLMTRVLCYASGRGKYPLKAVLHPAELKCMRQRRCLNPSMLPDDMTKIKSPECSIRRSLNCVLTSVQTRQRIFGTKKPEVAPIAVLTNDLSSMWELYATRVAQSLRQRSSSTVAICHVSSNTTPSVRLSSITWPQTRLFRSCLHHVAQATARLIYT